MPKKKEKENEKEKEENGAICPHCGKSHPPGTQYCTTLGIPLYQEIIEKEDKKLKAENEKLKEKRWFHLKLNIFFSTFIILMIILFLVIILGVKKDNNTGKGEGKSIKPIPDYLRSGGVTLKYQADPKYPQLVPDMVEAYLDKFGVSPVEKIQTGNEGTIVKGVIPGKDKPVNAEIHLLSLEKIKVTPGEKPRGAIEDLKKQLAAEQKKREEAETQLAAEKKEKQVTQNQLTGEQEKRRDVEAELETAKREIEKIQKKLIEKEGSSGETNERLKKVYDDMKKLEKKCYSAYINMAKQCYENSDWDTALDYINKAKQLDNTTETVNLSRNIQRAIYGSNSLVNFSDLSKEIRKSYLKETEIISIGTIPQGISINEAKDQITFILIINEKGKISIDKMSDKTLEVIPVDQKENIKGKIRERIQLMFLSPPRDKDGNPVKVKTWEFAFKVKILEEKLILLRRD